MSRESIVYTYCGSNEDDLFHGLPWEAQLLYVRVMRRYMDYKTCIVGGPKRRISLLMMGEILEIFPHQGMKGVRPDKSKVRRTLGWLERVGLIQRLEDKDGYLVYFLPHAKKPEHDGDAHFSEENKPDTMHNPSETQEEPYSGAGLSMVKNPRTRAKNAKPDTHLESRIKNQKTTTPTPPPENRQDASMADSVVGGDSDELSEPVKHATQSPQTIATPRQSSHTAAQMIKSAFWEEKLIFPDGLRDRDKTSIFNHLQRCPAEQRQAVVDELAARLGRVKTPSGYVRKLVDCVLSGEFIPEAGIPLAEARERRKNDFQTVLPTRKPAPSEEVSAEIARLTDAMVAAQRAGDFKQFSRLGAQVGRLS